MKSKFNHPITQVPYETPLKRKTKTTVNPQVRKPPKNQTETLRNIKRKMSQFLNQILNSFVLMLKRVQIQRERERGLLR